MNYASKLMLLLLVAGCASPSADYQRENAVLDGLKEEMAGYAAHVDKCKGRMILATYKAEKYRAINPDMHAKTLKLVEGWKKNFDDWLAKKEELRPVLEKQQEKVDAIKARL